MGIAVYVPWPISTCGITSVVCPERSMRMKALGANLPCVLSGGCSGSFTARAGIWKPSTNTPASPLCRSERREGERSSCADEYIGSLLCLAVARSPLDRLADADIGAAAADISCHRRVDVGVVGMRRIRKQRSRRHDLTGLAIAALDDFQIQPGLLDRGSRARSADALDRCNAAIADGADRQQTGAQRFALYVYSAGAALRDAAAEFGAGHAEHVAQHPKQWHVRGGVEASVFTVDI